jgi:glycerophosphoryl diester phosphodiesterase
LALFRRQRWLRGTAWVVGVIAFTYAATLLLARPVPPHAYFAAERPGLQVIAHRGGAGLRPEETLEAFDHAARLGADILDLDARATADGVIVCLHDATVDRTTDGSGPVAALTLAELRRLDAGYRWTQDGGKTFSYRGKGLQVPTLEEVLKRHARLRMVIEMKVRTPDFAQSLCSLVRDAGMAQRVLVASFDHATLDAFRQACPEVATSMSLRDAQVFWLLARLRLAAASSPDAVALQVPERFAGVEVLAPFLIEAARSRNLRVHAWTINDEEAMRRLIALGVDGIMTDRPDQLLALRGRAGPSR